MTAQVQAIIQSDLGALFAVTSGDNFLRIRTPFWYPDGGVVDVFVKERDGRFTLTDFGEALGWLRSQSLSGRRSPRQQKLVQDVCLTQGVEFFKGQLLLRCDDSGRLANGVFRLGQAMVRVADLWFTTRTRSVESVTDEVADLLQEKLIPFERGVKLAGRSGREWPVDFQTRTTEQSALVCVLASGSGAAARRVSEHVLAEWYDLNLLKTGAQPLRFVSLFDDTIDIWGEEDFRLVESVSDVCRWSRPDEFEQALRQAA
jgi:Domain of unknown function DUF1828